MIETDAAETTDASAVGDEPGRWGDIEGGGPHAERLLEKVHPPGWRAPTPADRYDLVVVGAGTAGLVSAAIASGLGARVALVERHLMGGDCLNVGCVPSKALLASAAAARAASHAEALDGPERRGARDGDGVDGRAVMERLRRIRADLADHDSAARFRELGVDVFLDHGRFVSEDTVTAGEHRLRFGRAIIATGAGPVVPPIPGLAESAPLTNEQIFELDRPPERLAVIGAGAIGCELAQAFGRLGTEVHLFEQADRILPSEDPDASVVLTEVLEREGIEVVTGARLAGVERIPGTSATERRVVFRVSGADDGQREVVVDEVLVAAGRVPRLDGLGLDAAGIAVDPDRAAGLRLDARLRTTNRRVYAVGDVAIQQRFTHAADATARMVVRNALFFGRGSVDDLSIPRVTYTDPEIAHAGVEPWSDPSDIDSYSQAVAGLDRAVLDGATDGFVRLHTRRGSDRIVGGTIVSRHGGEIVGEVVLAIQQGAGLADLSSLIHPYPTRAEALRKLGDAYQRTRLTPWRAKLIRWYLGLRRALG